MVDSEKVEEMLLLLEEKLDKTTSVLREEFTNIRAGRANPHVLDKIQVDYYGAMTPVNQVGNISVQDAKCLVISPWDASLLKGIEKAILASNIGLTPTNDGKVIRLIFPDLTEERRRDIAKQIKSLSEDSKVAVRNLRRDAMESPKTSARRWKRMSKRRFPRRWSRSISIPPIKKKKLCPSDRAKV